MKLYYREFEYVSEFCTNELCISEAKIVFKSLNIKLARSLDHEIVVLSAFTYCSVLGVWLFVFDGRLQQIFSSNTPKYCKVFVCCTTSKYKGYLEERK